MSLQKSVAHLFHPRRSNNHRSKLLHPKYIFGLFLVAFVFFTGTYSLSLSDTSLGNILGYASDITIDKVIASTNQERARSGLGEVTYSPVLSEAARRKAADMFAKQYWAHTSPVGKEPWDFMQESNYRYRVAGENLARDFLDTSSMFEAWMASPTHRANIMNARYTDIGIAVVNGTLLGTETTLVVQMFGNPIAVPVTEAQIVPAATPVPETVALQVQTVQPLPVNNEQAIALELSNPIQGDQQGVPSQVLSTIAVPTGELLGSPIITPTNLWRAFGIAMALLFIFTLLYDAIIAYNKRIARIVGKNFAHIILFSVVIYVIIFFKAGVIS